MCYEVVNLFNERLIGRYLIFSDDKYLCFNDFFLGRFIFKISNGSFIDLVDLRRRFEFV